MACESVVFIDISPFREKMYKHLAPIARRFIPGRGGGNYSAADYIHCWALIRKDLVRTGAEAPSLTNSLHTATYA